MKLIVLQIGICVCLLGLWLFVKRFFDVQDFIVPKASSVLQYATRHAWSRLGDFWWTLQCSGLAFALAILLSIGGSVPLAFSHKIARWPLVLAVVVQGIPIVAIAPIVGLYLGLDMAFEVTVALLIAGLPIYIISAKAMASAPQEVYIDACFLENKNKLHRLVAMLKYAKGPVLSVIRGSSPLAVVGAIVAEYIGVGKGLGFQVYHAATSSNTPALYASAILCTGCGFLFFAMVDTICAVLLPYGCPKES